MSHTCPKCAVPFTCGLGAFRTHVRFCGRSDDLFWAKVSKGDGCWLWAGALQRDGYAHFARRVAGRHATISAHRYAYEKLVGPIPEGLDLLHSCDVRHCVNPAHLKPGTHAENMKDAYAKGRHVHGESNYHARLTEAEVLAMRKAYRPPSRPSAKDSNLKELAAMYPHVAPTTVYAAASGFTWRHLK